MDYNLGDGIEGIRETAEILRQETSHLALHAMTLDPGAVHFARTSDPTKAQRTAAFAGAQVRPPGTL